MLIAGCGVTEIYKRMNSGRYKSFLDGTSRLIVVQSILDDQAKLLATAAGTPCDQPSKRGRPQEPAQEKQQPRPRHKAQPKPQRRRKAISSAEASATTP